jgi:hypothetical protein
MSNYTVQLTVPNHAPNDSKFVSNESARLVTLCGTSFSYNNSVDKYVI